ncbi:MAG: hypothetical protein JW763_04070 [candidate division Zixibacteria bacterium]|nr:hypothetical protein [candidate division Zixibacteria bacterium]
MLTAILVLVAGIYVVVFLPLPISPLARVLIGVLILVYFLWRVRFFVRHYGSAKSETDLRQ